MDIWEDRLLINDLSDDYNEHYLFEKKIGASQWNSLGLFQGIYYARANYIYNGTIIIAGSLRKMPDTKAFWFRIEDGRISDPVFEGLLFKSSWNTPIVAAGRSHLSEFRSTFDLDSKDWIVAYDLSTQQVKLATKKYSASNIVDYAISPNGDNIVLMTKKKIELYNINSQKDKKK